MMAEPSDGGGEPQGYRLTFAAKIGLLFGIFLAVPVILYNQFRAADADKNAVVIESIQRQGRMVAEAVRPLLARFDPQTIKTLNEHLARLGEEGNVSIKALLRPQGGSGDRGFFFVAAWPAVSSSYLEVERERLLETGIFARVKDSCEGNLPLALRYVNPGGREELIASLVPVTASSGCWVLITSFRDSAVLSSAIGRPYWRTPVVQVAAVIYLVMALVIVWLFADAWQNLRRFEGLARRIGHNGVSRLSFQRLNRIPELDSVATEFDRMVGTLRNSAEIIRQAAEDNAHALKGPVAVIAQAIEPIKRSSMREDDRVKKAVALIEQSIGRLDAMVSIARRLDEVTADILSPDREAVDVSRMLGRMIDVYRRSRQDQPISIEGRLETEVKVYASNEMLETVFENIIDNALSFSPRQGCITVVLRRIEGRAEVVIEDEGPGVSSDRLPRIFERYFSERPALDADADGEGEPGSRHFGIGLWIVRRNVQALGGEVFAENSPYGGLRIVVRLPLAR